MLQKLISGFKSHSIAERIGLSLSFACAVHCVLTPIFIAALPFMSSTVFANPAIEVVLLAASFVITGAVNLRGFMKHHKKYAPLVIMLLGFSLILSGHAAHNTAGEAVFATLGGLMLAYSLFLNRRKKEQAGKPACC